MDTDFDGSMDANGVSPFKPTVIAAFLTVFGGVGLILKNSSPISTLIISAGLGVLVALLFFYFILTPLYRAQNTSSVEKQSLIGKQAMVSEAIMQGRYGKITYIVNGNTYSAPAKSEDGSAIERKSSVSIVYIEKNTFFVRPI